MQIQLKYGLNPHQGAARIVIEGDGAPLQVLSGRPSYINILDALGAWQLVRELREATGKPGAASFKHVSPAGAAVARPLSDGFRRCQMLPEEDYSPLAAAYVRARGADRLSSFGDMVAVSDTVDTSLARVLDREVSDGIIAPAYEPDALQMLKRKQKGGYRIFRIDPDYEPPDVEYRDVFGMRLEEQRNTARITPDLLENVVTDKAAFPADVVETLIVATIALKHTQSNSVCVAYDGQVIGMGAGQQSRVHCTRLACSKADKWLLQQHPRVLALAFKDGLGRPERTNIVDQFLLWDALTDAEKKQMISSLDEAPEPLTRQERAEWIAGFEGICLSSDAFFPFRDSLDRASRSNVQYVLQPGGSYRDKQVTQAANEYGMVMAHSGLRCFLH
ncbi:MAG: phosphoribosylaminoimidazolecarboxamide formyltransferase [Planctomycetes bacterium]|nr:phosphoribosylaminoimidazolecarboxamide formyltransferase [Planctomycetota bacterium]